MAMRSQWCQKEVPKRGPVCLPVADATHKESQTRSAGVIIFAESKPRPSAHCAVIISVTYHSDRDYRCRVQTQKARLQSFSQKSKGNF